MLMFTNKVQREEKNKSDRHAPDNKNIYHCLNCDLSKHKGIEPVRTLVLHKDTPKRLQEGKKHYTVT